LDWVLWTATLTQDRGDFEALIKPVHDFLNETPQRVPMTDWYFTDTAHRKGFTARPVVGGVFLQMLYDQEIWTKYAARDKTQAAGWAPMPRPPKTEPFVPTSEREGLLWRYTTETPDKGWSDSGFDDSGWKEGAAGFGREGTPGAVVRTPWTTSDIWIRRSFTLEGPLPERAAMRIHHDEDAQVYLNGVKVLSCSAYTTDYEIYEIDGGVLCSGENTLAIHCRQTNGGQYIDAGIDRIVEEK